MRTHTQTHIHTQNKQRVKASSVKSKSPDLGCGGFLLGVQVCDDTGDAEGPSEAQQVGQVAEGAAQQDGPSERLVHGAPDGRRALRVLWRLAEEQPDYWQLSVQHQTLGNLLGNTRLLATCEVTPDSWQLAR